MTKALRELPTKPSVSQALRQLVDTTNWSVVNDQDISTIQWNDPDVAQPSDEVVQAKLDEMWAEYNLAMCHFQRKHGRYEIASDEDGNKGWESTGEKGYPEIGEQLDYIYHNGVDAWKRDMVDPVKAKFPKPE
jgi:hypothetical protein